MHFRVFITPMTSYSIQKMWVISHAYAGDRSYIQAGDTSVYAIDLTAVVLLLGFLGVFLSSTERIAIYLL